MDLDHLNKKNYVYAHSDYSDNYDLIKLLNKSLTITKKKSTVTLLTLFFSFKESSKIWYTSTMFRSSEGKKEAQHID